MKTNYNFLALQGLDVDDYDIAKRLDIDVALAYTSDIGFAMIEQSYYQQLAEGVDAAEAKEEYDGEIYRMKELLAQRGLYEVGCGLQA